MHCQRCNSLQGDSAIARVRSEVLNLPVCSGCAEEARRLGLAVEPLIDLTKEEPPTRQAAARRVQLFYDRAI